MAIKDRVILPVKVSQEANLELSSRIASFCYRKDLTYYKKYVTLL